MPSWQCIGIHLTEQKYRLELRSQHRVLRKQKDNAYCIIVWYKQLLDGFLQYY